MAPEISRVMEEEHFFRGRIFCNLRFSPEGRDGFSVSEKKKKSSVQYSDLEKLLQGLKEIGSFMSLDAHGSHEFPLNTSRNFVRIIYCIK
ncbi:hypothetical protein CEXT_334621 [Caerostris extrusa]|uniref:Uncharacterized protein n=1 Tax=Caerostris extrusa TaxID=172846 RepID=A0AAV4VW86_CAEEX|nr:hypothetical protein CEXT_334621 [Caerostris extrusa]